MSKRLVSIIGDAEVRVEDKKYKLARKLGAKLINTGDYRILTGGRTGIMEAASKGAKEAENYQEGDIVAISPGQGDKTNQFSDIVIATDLGQARNFIVANSPAVIAIGGGAGTLSELAVAWKEKRLIIGYRVSGWSGRLADTRVDSRVRYSQIKDKVFGVDTAEETLQLLEEYWEVYADIFHSR